ncbi:hypothetical protein C5L38_34385 (plasmid) [Streptomyces sp. WAC00288]|nr:hypothetical protein C5L38_34385 [Streptomyces sp. WAC00288]KYG51205.1 hypothetical protein AWI43_32785 [Streptomyces sp. WAC04657]
MRQQLNFSGRCFFGSTTDPVLDSFGSGTIAAAVVRASVSIVSGSGCLLFLYQKHVCLPA